MGSTPASPAGADADSDADAGRSCFICLLTAAETPGAAWVTPCPCTLEAHETCMLRWIAETETSAAAGGGGGGGVAGVGGGGGGGSRRALRCPACNSRIRTTEPFDLLLALGDRYAQLYRRAAPFFLLSMLMTMGVAGSSYYGFQSLLVFAGGPKTLGWLGLRRAVAAAGRVSVLRWREGMALVGKLFLLNLVAPALLLQRALPSLAQLLSLPASFVYGASLVSRNKLPRWPPSPAWALVAMPYVSMAYASAYYDLLGPLETRLNHALRGRPPADDGAEAPNVRNDAPPVPARADADAPVPPPGDDGGDDGDGDGDGGGDGIVATLRRVGTALANALRNDEQLVLENVGAAAAFRNGQDVEIQLEIVVGEQRAAVADAGDRPADREPADARENADAALPPPDIARGRPEEPNAAPAGPVGPAGPAGPAAGDLDGPGDRGGGILLPDIVAAMATQLLLPRIAAAVGQLLGDALPRAWVTKPPPPRRPTGLLQERWGRSLVGGLAFVVLRDAWALYAKYRRVQIKRQRKIKNVDRRRPRAAA